jgi:hypothetical protein
MAERSPDNPENEASRTEDGTAADGPRARRPPAIGVFAAPIPWMASVPLSPA